MKNTRKPWLLYLGNAIFLVCLFIFGTIYTVKEGDSTKSYNGFLVTTLGVIISCIFIFLLIFIFAPGIFNIGHTQGVLQQTPATFSKNNKQGVLFILFANSIIGNFTAGTFSAILTRSKAEEKKLPT